MFSTNSTPFTVRLKKTPQRLTFIRRFSISILLMSLSLLGNSQSITNGNFGSKGSGWGCSPEAIHMETTYGGSNSSNRVAEVDAAAGLCQTVSGFTIGDVYSISFDCSRRTSCGPTLQSMDVTIDGGALSTSVSRNGTSFSFASESFEFTATATSHTITFDGTSAGTCGLIVDNIAIDFIRALPVEFIQFEANKAIDNTVELVWATAMELNNDFFSVERSADGIHWTSLETIQGAGNSNEILEYQTIDPNPNAGVNYYRIKQTDFDGTSDYSSIQLVEMSSSTEKLKVYPNPAIDHITVMNIRSKDFTLWNSLGQDVSSDISNTVLSSGLKINLRELPNGIYTLKIGGQTKKIQKS